MSWELFLQIILLMGWLTLCIIAVMVAASQEGEDHDDSY